MRTSTIIRLMTLALLLACSMAGMAQKKFFNLTAEEVKIDSMLPYFYYEIPVGYNYTDSVYSATIEYPEFMDMSDADIARYQAITDDVPDELPEVEMLMTIDRKRGMLGMGFVPVVCREGKWQKLVSFMLDIKAQSAANGPRKAGAQRVATDVASRYAEHSVLATGRWAKIRVPETGVYQLTDALIQRAGFSNPSKVKIYGYGGNLQPEQLTAAYLTQTDDLKEVATCTVNGKRLFYARGPVSWNSNTERKRTRNYTSDYGYYFLTQTDDEPLSVDSTAFIDSYYPAPDDYHSLYEVDNYAWFEGGRNLYMNDPISLGQSKTYTIASPGKDETGNFRIAITAGGNATGRVVVNGEKEVSYNISLKSLSKGEVYEMNITAPLKEENTVTIYPQTGSVIRLDFISVAFKTPWPRKALTSASFPVPEYVHNITNQDLHQDRNIQMVIIIPTSQKLRAQAERLKAHHEQHDGLTVKIVPADELFNEFSSGTPEVNAYRRYLKMLYDRAETDEQMPQCVLMFGDALWDNRLNQPSLRSMSADDLLLCYESDNSFSKSDSYANEGYFTCLDDGEGGDPIRSDRPDIGIGRFPVRTVEEAKTMVDKTISYVENQNAGDWENIVVVMGDDGNNNAHMQTAIGARDIINELKPGMVVKPILWDAYERAATATGASYPEVTKLVKEQQANGALIMNYIGHGAENQISHENVLRLADFKNFNNSRLPLWITSSCDIAPFDGAMENIGEQVVLNKNGGAVAYYGSARTVFINYNDSINRAFTRFLFTKQNGKYVTLGEAQRLTKNSLFNTKQSPKLTGTDFTINKLQYLLLGDPALRLNIPEIDVKIDSINGVAVDGSAGGTAPALKAGSLVTISGHVERDGELQAGYNGTLTALVRDAAEHIVCRLNDTSTMSSGTGAFEYDDNTKTLFNGSNYIREGRFSLTFAMPKDINYTNEHGKINLFAQNNEKTLCGNGCFENFIIGGTEEISNDSIGPSIFCYLNSRDFVDGGDVNETPYFVAEVSDKDGLNTSGNGIGHDLELIIDGDMTKTYNLNSNFVYELGSYTKGSTHYSIPQLSAGRHTLKFRAWDILNNSSSAVLNFNVVKGLEPNLLDVSVTNNPARTSTTFIITHDRSGSNLEVELEIFDMSGRLLYRQQQTGLSTSTTMTIDWDLTIDNGSRLQTGVYLYRVLLGCDGSSKASKAKKLVVIN